MARPIPRERGPRHPGHFRKPKPPKKPPLRLAAAEAAARAAADPYKDGKTRIFLDDERACPAGWTPVKNVEAFVAALNACPPEQLAAVSLDWYLGVGYADGHAAAKALVDHLLARPAEFTVFQAVSCHSSDWEQAAKMARTIANAIRDHENLPWISVQLGMPGNARLR